MNYNGDKIIGLLGKKIEDKQVREMMKSFGAKKPILDTFFKEYGGCSVLLEDHKIELLFADSSFYDGTDNGIYGQGDLLFSGVMFREKTDIRLPFGLMHSDTLEDVYKKLGRKENYYDEKGVVAQKIWEFTTNNQQRALLYVIFGSGKYENVAIVNVYLYEPEHDEVFKDMKVS